jgi:uncharacterized protein with HEPN domain
MIQDTDTIAARHGGAISALADVEGRHALMMCCLQIGETLGKLQSPEIRALLPVELAYGLRNIIAHDYLGINDTVIVDTLTADLPRLRRAIQSISID